MAVLARRSRHAEVDPIRASVSRQTQVSRIDKKAMSINVVPRPCVPQPEPHIQSTERRDIDLASDDVLGIQEFGKAQIRPILLPKAERDDRGTQCSAALEVGLEHFEHDALGWIATRKAANDDKWRDCRRRSHWDCLK